MAVFHWPAAQCPRLTSSPVPVSSVQRLYSGVGSSAQWPHSGLRNAGMGHARGEGQTKPSQRAPLSPTACDGPLRQHGLRPPLGGSSLFSLSQGSYSRATHFKDRGLSGEALKRCKILVLSGQFFLFAAAYPESSMISDTYSKLSVNTC